MLRSVKMARRNGRVAYPEEVKEAFLATGGLDFKYTESVSAEEMWEYMTVEAPQRYPNFFNDDPNVTYLRPHPYLEMLWRIKYDYCTLTMKDRLSKARKKGVPVVFVQGGQSQEPYFAANTIAARPKILIQFGGEGMEGLTYRQRTLREREIIETGRKLLSPETCHGMVASFSWMHSRVSPVDFVAPYLALRCSDCAYITERFRSVDERTPTLLVDFPVDYRPGQDWKIECIADDIHRLVKKLAEIGGTDVSDEDLRKQIKQNNYIRQLGRAFIEAWMNAKYLPSYGADVQEVTGTVSDLLSDPVSTTQILELAKAEILERVENEVRCAEIVEDPVRLFVIGSCYVPNRYRIERQGGAVILVDEEYSRMESDVEEEGDPYWNLAKAALDCPYELPSDERARWAIKLATKGRCDGVIIIHNWGCNYQSGVSRLMGDVIKKEGGLPVCYLEIDSLTRKEQLEQSENRIDAFIEMLQFSKM